MTNPSVRGEKPQAGDVIPYQTLGTVSRLFGSAIAVAVNESSEAFALGELADGR
jgi:hypothetical protein